MSLLEVPLGPFKGCCAVTAHLYASEQKLGQNFNPLLREFLCEVDLPKALDFFDFGTKKIGLIPSLRALFQPRGMGA